MNGLTWVNALALAGATFVALPILIHLMGRAPARVRRFPSLRFLTATRLLPLRRTRIQDPLLLALRVLTVIVAALALAGPVLDAASPLGARSPRAVAVVVDTSASVDPTAARTAAQSVIAGASASAVVRTARPGAAVAGASAWLERQSGTHTLVLVSDFQVGAIDTADLTSLPASTSVSARRVASSGNVAWARADARSPAPFEVIAASREGAEVALTHRVASTAGAAAIRGPQPSVAVAYATAPNRGDLERGSTKLAHRWQGELVTRLARDPLLDGLDRVPARFAADQSGERLLVLMNAAVASEASVSMHAALIRAIGGPLNASETDSRRLTDAELAALVARPVVELPLANDDAPAESAWTRWLWLAVLLLLATEWAVRRLPPPAAA